jgi:hypothetical protein
VRYWLSKIEASGAYRDLCFAARQAGIGILVIEIHILPSGALKSSLPTGAEPLVKWNFGPSPVKTRIA